MKKIVLLLACLMLLFSQAEAKKGINLSLGLGHTWAIGEMDKATRGKNNFNLSGDYEFASAGANQYFAFLVGLKFSLPRFDGEGIYYAVDPGGPKTITSDWRWVALTPYFKILIDKNDKPLVPYFKFGVGLYHLSIKYNPTTYLGDISKNYLGYVVGFGVEYNIGRLAFTGELEGNFVPHTNLELLTHKVRNCNFINPMAGMTFRF
ncbi:MAG: outer membrane beta-barrel protein [candidate division Zixibacteria bacterium]|nr:outer membrane beta-barrel protein [candidate division Zixibacteria bacterium]